MCHRCFTRLTGQGLTNDQIAATPQCQYPWPGVYRFRTRPQVL